MRIATDPERPALHASITAPGWVGIAHGMGGVNVRMRLTLAEAVLLADTLVDCVELASSHQPPTNAQNP